MIVLSLISLSHALTGTPDSWDVTFVDPEEALQPAPPHQVLEPALGNVGTHNVYTMGDDALELIQLPFTWNWYGSDYNEAWVSSNGVLFFEGETSSAVGSCPTDNLWSGIAPLWQDWSSVTVETAVFGRYPYRTFLVDWQGQHATVGGNGRVQLWMTEGAGNPQVSLFMTMLSSVIPQSILVLQATVVYKVKPLVQGLHGVVSNPCPVIGRHGLVVQAKCQWRQRFAVMTCFRNGWGMIIFPLLGTNNLGCGCIRRWSRRSYRRESRWVCCEYIHLECNRHYPLKRHLMRHGTLLDPRTVHLVFRWRSEI